MKLNSKSSIKIIDEYKKLLRPQNKQERSNLKQSLMKHGFLEAYPIVLNQNHELIDGHHRLMLCEELGIESKFIVLEFKSKTEGKLFIRDFNLARRQASLFDMIEAELSLKPTLQEIAKANESLGGKGVQIKSPLGRVNDEIGRRVGAGKETVRKVELLLKIAPEELLNKLRSNSESINGAYNKIIKEQIRHELTIKAASKAITAKANCNTRFELINGDFRQVKEISDNSVDLVFTDPPYEGDYLTIYDDLAKFANRNLVEDGSLVTYLIQSELPTIIRYMENAGLSYYWIFATKLVGPFPREHDKHIVITWKPLMWFTKGKRNTQAYDYIRDFINSSSPNENKNFHPWAQSCTEAEQIISKLTLENQIVMDPMMGSGTAGIAALKLKRKFIGVEIDPNRFAVAKSNIYSKFSP